MSLIDALQAIRRHPNYFDPDHAAGMAGKQGASAALDPNAVNRVIWHDWGTSRPDRPPPGDIPYNVLVMPNGQIRPGRGGLYGQSQAAYGSNRSSWNPALYGPVGGQPSPEAQQSLSFINSQIGADAPGIQQQTHGQAYQDTRGTPFQASRDGRGPLEASWLARLGNAVIPGAQAQGAQPPGPLSLVQHAGLTPPPMGLGGPQPEQPDNPQGNPFALGAFASPSPSLSNGDPSTADVMGRVAPHLGQPTGGIPPDVLPDPGMVSAPPPSGNVLTTGDVMARGNVPPPPQANPLLTTTHGIIPPAGPAPLGAPGMSMLGGPPQERGWLGEGGHIDRMLTNPVTLMGLTTLLRGDPAAGANASAAISRGRMAEMDLQSRQGRRQAWNAAFPNGQPNASHPLLAGVPPELVATAFAMGPDQGLTALGQLAMTRSTQQLQIEHRRQIADVMHRIMTGQGGQPQPGAGAQPPPVTMAPPAPGAGLSDTGIPGMSGPGTLGNMMAPPPPSPMAAPAPTGQPPPAQPPPAAGVGTVDTSGAMTDPAVQAAMIGSIMAGDMQGAMTALEQAGRQYRDVQLAGPRAQATKTGEQAAADQNRGQAAQRMWGLVDQAEQAATAMGDARLAAALSPYGPGSAVGGSVSRFTSPEAFNDRGRLQTYINSLIIQAREAQRGLGPLSDQETRTLADAYASMQNATDPNSFRAALDTVRHVLSSSIPSQSGYVPRWMQQQGPTVGGQPGTPPPAGAATPPPMTPPPGGRRENYDRNNMPAELEGRTVYNNETGTYGQVIGRRWVPVPPMGGMHPGANPEWQTWNRR